MFYRIFNRRVCGRRLFKERKSTIKGESSPVNFIYVNYGSNNYANSSKNFLYKLVARYSYQY